MKKTLLKFRNADSTLDLNTQFADFFNKGIVLGGMVAPVFPNSTPQVTVSPFKLVGADGMVVIETSDIELLNLPANQTTVICFRSLYVTNNDPDYGFEAIEISLYNSLSSQDKRNRTIFAVVTTAAPNALPVVSLDLRDVIDPVGRNSFRGVVSNISFLPISDNRLGDRYLVESGVPDPNNGLYVWKGGLGWVNITDSLSLSSLLAQHRSNLFANEIHLTNNQADAVQGTSGSPSNTNRFVTDQDPRVPTQGENDALVGLSQNVPVAPSASNPFVTAAYNVAQAQDVLLAPPGGTITLNAVQGPFYVGLGVGMASILPYFKLYHPTENREYVDSTGAPVQITAIYKNLVGPTPLDPSTETSVSDANGFWANTIHVAYSGTIDTNVRIRYGRQINLENVQRNFGMLPGPQEGAISSETIKRLSDISGRLFDDPMQTGETNVELKVLQSSVRRYLNTTTSSDLVVPSRVFPRLREVPDIAADFPADYAEIQEFGTSPANYTVYWLPADVANFDPGFTEDVPVVAYVEYDIGTVLPTVQAGWIWEDDVGARFRILAHNPAARTILLYTQGSPINTNNANGNVSKIYRANNYRKLELVSDHTLSMYREFFPVDEVVAIKDEFEKLPPGGVQVGTYVVPNNFSLIGQGALPNQGNPNGSSRGRPMFYVKPFNSGQIPDQRLILIGSWTSDPTLPRQAIGNVSQGSLGVEYTGRLTRFTLYTKIRPNMPYAFRVFVDGVYNHTASKFINSAEIATGLIPSNSLSSLRGDSEKAMMPLIFDNLGLSDDLVHTVRVEVTNTGGGDFFPLYGVETFFNGALEDKGNAFTQTDFRKTLASQNITTPYLSSQRGRKMVRFLDRATGARQVANSLMPIVFDLAATVAPASLNFTSIPIAQGCNIGDVILLTNRQATASDPANYVYRRITAIDRSTNVVTMNAVTGFSLPSSGFSRIELVFKTPASPTGIAVPAAPVSQFQDEYARFFLNDWSVGLSRDISLLSDNATESRVTVLDDATTALSVVDCRRVNSGIEGFSEAIRFDTTVASMTMTAWCTGMDVVFVGSGGTPTTVTIEIDGMISYQLTVPNDGMVRHSLFSDGSPQSHTVRIFNPSVANTVCVGQWIFHTIATPEYDGTGLAEYEVGRNATAAVPAYFDFAPTSVTNPLVVSNAGVRLFDITKYGARLYDGTTGSTAWTVTQDFALNRIFGNYLRTNKEDAVMEIQFVGSHFELYYLAGPDQGIAQMFINGLAANSTNFPNGFGAGYVAATGRLNQYSATTNELRRIVFTNLPFGQHVFRLQNTNTKDPLSTDFFVTAMMAAENAGSAVIQRRFAEDKQINRLHLESFRDIRQFLSLTSEQVGVVSALEEPEEADQIPLGYIDSAFCMSDGSGTEQNCTVGMASGQSYVDVAYTFVPAVNPGKTTGDLDVIVDGLVIPRRVVGVTLDSWYEEDLLITGRIKLWTDISGSPISIEVRRKAGTVDTSTTNSGRLAVTQGLIVGSPLQVSAGLADYATLSDAITASPVGGLITVLAGVSITENVVLNKRVTIVGQGYDSRINGTFTLQSVSDFSTVKSLYCNQYIIQLGAVGNQIVDAFWDVNPTDANGIGLNRITGMLTV
jgi:hypothetical protein